MKKYLLVVDMIDGKVRTRHTVNVIRVLLCDLRRRVVLIAEIFCQFVLTMSGTIGCLSIWFSRTLACLKHTNTQH